MHYAGICRGGPWDGERIVHDAPWYQRAEWPGLTYVDANTAPASITMTVRVHAYNWDYDMKVWRYVS